MCRTKSIYNIIHADATGTLVQHTRHKLKYRRRPKHKHFPIADRISIHQRPEQADGKRFGDYEMDLIVDRFGHAILTIVERFYEHALHDQTCPWEEVRAVGQIGQTSAAALQEIHQDHHH